MYNFKDQNDQLRNLVPNQIEEELYEDANITNILRTQSMGSLTYTEDEWFDAEEEDPMNFDNYEEEAPFNEFEEYIEVSWDENIKSLNKQFTLIKKLYPKFKNYFIQPHNKFKTYNQPIPDEVHDFIDNLLFVIGLRQTTFSLLKQQKVTKSEYYHALIVFDKVITEMLVEIKLMFKRYNQTSYLNQYNYYMSQTSKDYMYGIIEHAYQTIMSKRVDRYKLYMRTQDVMKSHRYTHPYIVHSNQYIIPSRTRQQQREAVLSNVQLINYMKPKHSQKLNTGFKIFERKKHYVVENTKTRQRKILSKDISDTDMLKFSRDLELQSDSLTTSALITQIRDYFVQNTATGRMLTAACWHHVAASLIQIILHLIQCFKGGSKTISVLGIILAVTTFINGFIQLAGLGVTGDTTQYEKLLDQKVKSYITELIQKWELTDSLPNGEKIDELVNKVVINVDPTNPKPEEHVSKLQKTKDDFDKELDTKKLDLPTTLYQVPTEMVELLERPQSKQPVVNDDFNILKQLKPSRLLDSTQLYIPYYAMQGQITSTYHNDCMYHSIFGQYDGKMYKADTDELKKQFTLQSIDEHLTSDEIQMLYIAIVDQVDDELPSLPVMRQTILNHIISDRQKNVEVLLYISRMFNKRVVLFLEDNFDKYTVYNANGADLIFIRFKAHQKHFEKVKIDELFTYGNQTNFNTNVIKCFKSIEKLILLLDGLDEAQTADLLEYYRSLTDMYNTLILTGQTKLEGDTITKEKLCQYAITGGVNIIAITIALWSAFTDPNIKAKSLGNRVVEFASVSRCTKTELSETYDLMAELMSDLFGICISPDTVNRNLLHKHIDKMQYFNSVKVNKYVCDYKLYYLAKSYTKTVTTDLNNLMAKQRTSSQGYINTEKHLRGLLSQLESKLKNVNDCMNTFMTRQETLPVRIYGAHGAGKTKYATEKLNIDVAKAVGINPTVCNLNFGDNKFYPILKGEQIMVYDEFLARREDDPIITDFNSIHSSNLFSLDAADVLFKNQQCNFLVSFLISNSAYEDLSNAMTREAERGFYSRFLDIHFVNVKQTKEMGRVDIPRGDFEDIEHYEIREYTTEATKDRNTPLISARTVISDTAYNKALDEYDDTVYSSGNNAYRLLTHKQLVKKIATRMKKFELNYERALTREAEFHLQREFTTKDTATAYTTFLEERGYPEKIIKSVVSTFKLEMDLRDTDALDHYVVNVSGQGGTGKSTSAKVCGRYLSQLTGMPFLVLDDLKDDTIKSITRPSVLVLEDCVYDENKYINFYDVIPKPSILFVTHNIPMRRVTKSVSDINGVNTPELKQQLEQRTNPGYFMRMFNTLLSYGVIHQKMLVWEIDSLDTRNINGFIRRLGLPGAHYHGGMVSKRPVTSCMCVTTASGYKIYENVLTDSTSTYVEMNEKTYTEKVYKGFKNYCKVIGEPEVIPCSSEKVQELVSQFTNGGKEIDVYVQAPTLEDLIEFTNHPAKLMRAYSNISLLKKDGYQVKISQNVRSSAFNYEILDFAIPKNTKPEDAKSMALLMYRLLLSGNTTFTCHIVCKEFQAICKDGQIHYALNANITKTGFQHTYIEDRMQFEYIIVENDKPAVSKLLWAPTKEQFVDCIVNGFEKEQDFRKIFKFDEQLDFMSYCHTITNEPELANLMFVARDKQSLTLENIQEKMKFLKVWEYFKDTFAYKIILVIMGLFTAYFIAMLVKMFIDFILPKNQNSGTMIVMLDDERKAECIYTYDLIQSLEDNFDDIEARFNCDIIDYDHDEMSRSTFRRRFIENIINCVQPRDEKLKFVKRFTLDKITLQSSKTNKVQQTKVTTRPSLFDKLEGKNTLYAENKQTKIKPEKSRAVDIVKLEGQTQMDDIFDNIEKNVCVVRTYNKEGIIHGRMHGLALKNNIIVTMYHSISDRLNSTLNPLETYTQKVQFITDKTATEYSTKTLLRDKANDLMFIQITDKTFQPKKDITHFFLKEGDKPQSEVEFRTYDNKVHFLVRNVHLGIARAQNLAYDTINLKTGVKTYLTTVYNTTGIVSKPGDCGLPLFSRGMSAPRTIMGLHFGSSMCYLAANCITQEYLQKDVYPRLVSTEAEIIEEPRNPKEPLFKVQEITFTGPDGKVEQVAVDLVTADLMLNSVDSEQRRFKCLVEGEHTVYLGYTHTGARSNRLKPKYVPTPFTEQIAKYKPNLEANSVTDDRLVEDPSNLPVDGNGNHSILIGQQNKLNDPVDAIGGPIGKHHLKLAQRLVNDHYVQNYGKYKHRLLTDLEVINGLCINPRDNFYLNLESISMDGACGADLAAKFHIGQKRELFTPSGQLSPSGKTIYVFKDTEAAQYVQEQQTMQMEFWVKNYRCESLVQSNLKCELRPLEKVRLGKTRCFESFTTATSNNVRRLLGTQFAAYKMERHCMFGQVGIDVTDFNQLYHRFRTVGCFGENGDFSAWDKHLLEDVITLTPEIWTNVFFAQYDLEDKLVQQQKQEYYNCMQQVAISNYKSIVIANGHIFTKNRGNCSGSQTTTMLNGVVNDLYRVACIIHLAEQHNQLVGKMGVKEIKEIYLNLYANFEDLRMLVKESRNIHEPIQISSMGDILKITDWINYGDDVCSVIASDYLWFLNFPRLKQAYQFLFGIEYDLPSKDGGVQTFIPLTEMSFISRTMYYDQNLCVVTPRLKESSIQRLLHWTTSNSFQQLTTNILEIFDEVMMYDEQTYNFYKILVNTIVNPYLQRLFGATTAVPDYYSKRALFARQALNRETQRNISNAILAREIDKNSDIITIDQLRKIFESIVLQGSEVTPSIWAPVYRKMTQQTYVELLPIVHDVADALINYFPRNIEIAISGHPAMITNREKERIWSISYKVSKTPLPLMEYEKLFKRNINKSGVNFKLIGVFEVDIHTQTPEKRIQIQIQQLPNRAVQLLDNKRATDFVKLQSAEGAPLDVKPQETPGVPLITPTSGLPAFLPKMEYAQRSCAALAHTYAPLVSYQLIVGSTEGKVIFNMQHKDLVNELMILSKKGDRKFFGSFIVKVENSANMGLTGTLIIGTTRTKLAAPTEFDLLEKTYFQLDAVTRNVVELTIAPFSDGVPKTVFDWPPSDTSANNFPSLVCIVKSDFVSTFDNKALYSQLHLYTKFSQDFQTFYTGLPAQVITRNTRPEVVAGFSIDAASVVGEHVRFYTDGGYYVNRIQKPVYNRVFGTLEGNARYRLKPQHLIDYTEGARHTLSIMEEPQGLMPLTMLLTTAEGIKTIEITTMEVAKYFDIKCSCSFSQKALPEPEMKTIWSTNNDRVPVGIQYRGKSDNTTTVRLSGAKLSCYYSTVFHEHPPQEEGSEFGKNDNIISSHDMWQQTTERGVGIRKGQSLSRIPDAEITYNSDGHIQSIHFDTDIDIHAIYSANLITTFSTAWSYEVLGGGLKRSVFNTLYGGEMFIQSGAPIEMLFPLSTVSEVGTLNTNSSVLVPVGGSSINGKKVPNLVPPANAVTAQLGQPTMFPDVDLFKSLEPYFGDKIYLIDTKTITYNQTLFSFIYHGPQKCCFLNTRKVEYLVGTETSENLLFTVRAIVPKGGQLPITSYESSALYPRTGTMLSLQKQANVMAVEGARIQNLTSVRLEGAALGGGLAGVGQGIANQWFMEQNFEQQYRLQLMQQGFQGDQLEKKLHSQMELLQQNLLGQSMLAEQNFGNSKEFLQMQSDLGMRQSSFQNTLRNMNNPGLMMQKQRNEGLGMRQPFSYGAIIQDENVANQFDLQTGKRELIPRVRMPKVNEHTYDYPLHRPLPAVPTDQTRQLPDLPDPELYANPAELRHPVPDEPDVFTRAAMPEPEPGYANEPLKHRNTPDVPEINGKPQLALPPEPQYANEAAGQPKAPIPEPREAAYVNNPAAVEAVREKLAKESDNANQSDFRLGQADSPGGPKGRMGSRVFTPTQKSPTIRPPYAQLTPGQPGSAVNVGGSPVAPPKIGAFASITPTPTGKPSGLGEMP